MAELPGLRDKLRLDPRHVGQPSWILEQFIASLCNVHAISDRCTGGILTTPRSEGCVRAICRYVLCDHTDVQWVVASRVEGRQAARAKCRFRGGQENCKAISVGATVVLDGARGFVLVGRLERGPLPGPRLRPHGWTDTALTNSLDNNPERQSIVLSPRKFQTPGNEHRDKSAAAL